MAAGYALAWAFVQILFIIDVIFDHTYETLILLLACVPQSEKREAIKERRQLLDLASSFYQGIHVGRRKEENG